MPWFTARQLVRGGAVAGAAALLGAATVAPAHIVYRDIPDIVVSNLNLTGVGLDVDGDGFDDYQLRGLIDRRGVDIGGNLTTNGVLGDFFVDSLAFRLTLGNPIGNGRPFEIRMPLEYVPYAESDDSGWVSRADPTYAGLRLASPAGLHYAWMRWAVTDYSGTNQNPRFNVTVYDVAYESVHVREIRAGYTPEPAAGMTGIAAAALLTLRRGAASPLRCSSSAS